MPRFETETHLISCPYCGETIELIVDLSVEAQEYTEDCSVCCNPMILSVHTTEDGSSAIARTENE